MENKHTHYVQLSRIRVVSSGKLPVLTKNLPGHSIFVIWMDYLKDTLTNQVFLKDNTVTRRNIQIEPPCPAVKGITSHLMQNTSYKYL